jgi:ATP-dependent DNA ligase
MKKFPRLFYKGKTGAMHQWDIWTQDDKIYTRHGQVDGKLQESCKRAVAKNVGRSNNTTNVEQAELEAAAMHKHKLDRKYSLTLEEASQTLFLPMTAHDFKKHHNPITYPVFVQRKYDGFRCLASKEDGVVTLYSRSGDVFDLPHISDELEQYMPDGFVLDGELYCHNTPFQKIASWIKKHHPESKKLKYIVYDIPESDCSGRDMTDRARLLQVLSTKKWKSLEIAPTETASSKDEVLEYEKKFVDEGFEGAIVRLANGKYQYGYRSYALLKVKSFQDEEFEVVGGRPGVGKMSDQCIFQCVVGTRKGENLQLKGKTFNVVPMGDAAQRREYLKNLKKYIGKKLTVKFQGKSLDGIPRFPVGKAFREKFDK